MYFSHQKGNSLGKLFTDLGRIALNERLTGRVPTVASDPWHQPFWMSYLLYFISFLIEFFIFFSMPTTFSNVKSNCTLTNEM